MVMNPAHITRCSAFLYFHFDFVQVNVTKVILFVLTNSDIYDVIIFK